MTGLVGVAEVARATGYKPSRIRSLAASGGLPACRLNGTGHWRFDLHKVLACVRGERSTELDARLESAIQKARETGARMLRHLGDR